MGPGVLSREEDMEPSIALGPRVFFRVFAREQKLGELLLGQEDSRVPSFWLLETGLSMLSQQAHSHRPPPSQCRGVELPKLAESAESAGEAAADPRSKWNACVYVCMYMWIDRAIYVYIHTRINRNLNMNM